MIECTKDVTHIDDPVEYFHWTIQFCTGAISLLLALLACSFTI